MLARAALALGDADTARRTIEETQALIDDTGARYYQPFLHELRAEYVARHTAPWQRQDELAAAMHWFERLAMPGQVARIRRCIG